MLRVLLLVLAVADLGEGWKYVHVAAPRATPPGDDVAWSERVDADPSRELWYRVPLPPLPDDARLVFRSYAGTFDLFVDEQKIYSFHEPVARGHLRLHSVPLPSGRHLYVRVARGERPPLFGGSPAIATPAAAPLALARAASAPLRDDLAGVIVGAILTILGVISFAVSRVRSRGNASALLWFGVFTALYGLRLLVDSYLPLLLGFSMRSGHFAESWITYVITIPGWMLARALLGDGWRGSLRWQVWTFAAFAPIALASDLVQREPGSLELVNNALVIIGGVNILLNALSLRGGSLRVGRTRELRVVIAGAVLFLLFALNNNLAAFGVLPWSEADETAGFVVFVAALGYAATRGFVRGERERLEIEGELATAREIQRSILPTEMPSVAGLRFHARYDPATSVAGDLYDFIAADDSRVGVLVADVAGHGVPAALIASMVKIAVSSQASLAGDPAAMLQQLNRTLKREVRRAFVTATWLFFDMEQRTVTVANAGHAPPLLLRHGAFQELGPTGILLGRFGDATYTAGTTELRTGDRILAWTDGIVEARNASGEAFGEERLQRLAREHDAANVVVDAVHAWRNADDDADDLTLVVIDVVWGTT